MQGDFLDQLVTAIAVNRLVIVKGDRGSGKSYCCQLLINAVAETEYCAYRIGLHAATGCEGLQRALARLSKTSAVVVPDGIRATLQRLSADMATASPLLLIDDAQYLSPFALKDLLQAAEGFPSLTIVLFIEARIMAERLASVFLGQSAAASFELPRLDDAQAQALVAATQGEATLDDARVRELLRRAHGRPGVLQALVRDALVSQSLGRPHARPFWQRPQVWAGGVLLLLFVVGLRFIPLGPPRLLTPLATLPADKSDVAGENEAAENMTAVSGQAIVHGDRVHALVNVPSPQVVEETMVPGFPSPLRSGNNSPMHNKQPSTPTAVAVLSEQALPEGEKALSEKLTDSAKILPVSDESFRGEDWIKQQAAGDYTIQIISFNSQQEVYRYMRRRHLEKKAAYLRTRFRAKPLYLIVYGHYPSLAAAKKALPSLPASLRRYQPWVRQFSSLVRLIDKAQQPLPATEAKPAVPAPALPDTAPEVRAPTEAEQLF